MITKHKIFLSFFLSFFSISFFYPQTNLVINPSFEIYSGCPVSTSGEVNKASGWDTCRASSDYFHVCASTSAVRIPHNYFGRQWPANGNAYSGFWTYASAGLYREFIIGQLTSPLVVSQKYYISFKVSRGDSISVTGYSNNKLGAKLTKTKLSYAPINNSAHYFSNNVITDTIGWTRLFGSIVADSTYKFIMLGNFFDDANTTAINDFSGLGAYYYIDDVCLSTDSAFTYNYATSIKEYSEKFNLKTFPNPADNFFILNNINNSSLKIVNSMGIEFYVDSLIKESEIKVDCTDWPDGIYIINTNQYIYKLIIKH